MFKLEERQIFEFDDMSSDKPFKAYADPCRVLRRIKATTQGMFQKMVLDSKSPDGETASNAIDAITKAMLFAFELSPFNPATKTGWLEVHLLGLADRFNAYLTELKKNTRNLPTGLPPTQDCNSA